MFCNNVKPERSPGRISGNPASGLCERVCLQAKKVFDACLSQTAQAVFSVTATDPTPSSPTYPLTFVSAASTGSTATVSDVTVTQISADSQCQRVQATVNIPVRISYTDANGVPGYATGTVSVPKDVILNVPSSSLIQTNVAASANLVAPVGSATDELTFSITACLTILLKVEAEVEILLPSYGYCYIPPCREYSATECSGVFDLPLFPPS